MPAASGFLFLESLLASRTGLPNPSKREMPVVRKSTAKKIWRPDIQRPDQDRHPRPRTCSRTVCLLSTTQVLLEAFQHFGEILSLAQRIKVVIALKQLDRVTGYIPQPRRPGLSQLLNRIL